MCSVVVVFCSSIVNVIMIITRGMDYSPEAMKAVLVYLKWNTLQSILDLITCGQTSHAQLISYRHQYDRKLQGVF